MPRGIQPVPCSVSTTRRFGCRSSTPPKMRCQTARCENHASSISMIARAASCSPKSGRPLPLCTFSTTSCSSHRSHKRLVTRIPERRDLGVRWHVRQQDPAEHVHVLVRPPDLGDRVVDVVQEDLGESGAPARRGRAEVGDPTVVRLEPGPTPFVVGRRRLQRGEVALREERRHRVREQHLGDDALRLGFLQPAFTVPVAVRGRGLKIGERIDVAVGPARRTRRASATRGTACMRATPHRRARRPR